MPARSFMCFGAQACALATAVALSTPLGPSLTAAFALALTISLARSLSRSHSVWSSPSLTRSHSLSTSPSHARSLACSRPIAASPSQLPRAGATACLPPRHLRRRRQSVKLPRPAIVQAGASMCACMCPHVRTPAHARFLHATASVHVGAYCRRRTCTGVRPCLRADLTRVSSLCVRATSRSLAHV
eukprot:3379019-Pleurochrysis_carterae.AAC.1